MGEDPGNHGEMLSIAAIIFKVPPHSRIPHDVDVEHSLEQPGQAHTGRRRGSGSIIVIKGLKYKSVRESRGP
jgi:hypothetical protein